MGKKNKSIDKVTVLIPEYVERIDALVENKKEYEIKSRTDVVKFALESYFSKKEVRTENFCIELPLRDKEALEEMIADGYAVDLADAARRCIRELAYGNTNDCDCDEHDCCGSEDLEKEKEKKLKKNHELQYNH